MLMYCRTRHYRCHCAFSRDSSSFCTRLNTFQHAAGPDVSPIARALQIPNPFEVSFQAMIARLFTIKGRVQGVFFRASTKRRADELGITGYAINLPDGDVEVLACGDRYAVESLADWLHEGPSAADVRAVVFRDSDASPPPEFTTG